MNNDEYLKIIEQITIACAKYMEAPEPIIDTAYNTRNNRTNEEMKLLMVDGEEYVARSSDIEWMSNFDYNEQKIEKDEEMTKHEKYEKTINYDIPFDVTGSFKYENYEPEKEEEKKRND